MWSQQAAERYVSLIWGAGSAMARTLFARAFVLRARTQRVIQREVTNEGMAKNGATPCGKVP